MFLAVPVASLIPSNFDSWSIGGARRNWARKIDRVTDGRKRRVVIARLI